MHGLGVWTLDSEIRQPCYAPVLPPWRVIHAISGVEVLDENKEIQSSIIERVPHIADMIQSALYPANEVRIIIMPIRVLRENRATQEAKQIRQADEMFLEAVLNCDCLRDEHLRILSMIADRFLTQVHAELRSPETTSTTTAIG